MTDVCEVVAYLVDVFTTGGGVSVLVTVRIVVYDAFSISSCLE